jgi:hypothetical protein
MIMHMTQTEYMKAFNAQEQLLRDVKALWDCSNPYNQSLIYKMTGTILSDMSALQAEAMRLGYIKPII